MSEQQPDVGAQVYKAINNMASQMGRVVAAFFEQNRPLIEALAEIAQRPEVQAEIRRREERRALFDINVPPRPPCYCLCGVVHPDRMGICDGTGTTKINRWAPGNGGIGVPVCLFCSAAITIATGRT